MINILVYIILLTLVYLLFVVGILKFCWEIILLVNLVDNPFRVYHIIALFGFIAVGTVITILYFENVTPYIKLL